ncbi:sodium-dependent transporter [Desulfolucanica intricata]|uniref:sodium-dependent transporter n=1 Tax=Desulfolucanica intricata TaxID=1285191 RepID=UPI00083163D6|nr:sodium-dependent transporter [Desulfolucanica intricata]
MAQREQWGTRVGFILAAVGSAIGLGNIWRFPYMAYDNGGGAFLIPYFFALLTAGIPIMILEFGLGHKYKGSAPLTFAQINPKWEILGWWQVMVSFVIAVYYVIIIAWSFSYIGFSFNQAWGGDPTGFFIGNFLGLTDNPLNLGGLNSKVLIPLLIVWLINFVILFTGVKNGIEKANKVMMPLLFFIMIIIAIRGVTLPGAAEGLNYLFQPDFSKILNYKVWVAAYGQIFFTLSIAFAIMISYSSYLPPKSDIVNNGFMTALINCGFSLLAGLAVFGILGYMAQAQGVPFDKVVDKGIFLAFATFPQAISELPVLQGVFGALFFLSLFFAGLTSAISINEAVISGLIDKFNSSRKKITTIYCLVASTLSLIFATGAGLYILDIVDHFINNFGIVFGGLVEVILLSWFFKLDTVKKHINPISDFTVGNWWNFTLKVVTPIVLGYMAVQNLLGDIRVPYGGYTNSALLIMGWSLLAAVLVGAFILNSIKWKDGNVFVKTKE